MFGIIDLASLPKDRFWLYRSVWNTKSPTLHVLPHWNWEEGQNVPVFVYTSWPSAELFEREGEDLRDPTPIRSSRLIRAAGASVTISAAEAKSRTIFFMTAYYSKSAADFHGRG